MDQNAVDLIKNGLKSIENWYHPQIGIQLLSDSNLDGLESKSLTIPFVGPNCLSLKRSHN